MAETHAPDPPTGDAEVLQLEPMLVSVPVAAELLSISTRTAYDMARRGELPTVRIGGRLLVAVAELRAWVVDHLQNVRPA